MPADVPYALQVRKSCLSTMAKVVYHCPAEMLHELLTNIPISSCIATLLAAKDANVSAGVMPGVQLLMIGSARLGGAPSLLRYEHCT